MSTLAAWALMLTLSSNFGTQVAMMTVYGFESRDLCEIAKRDWLADVAKNVQGVPLRGDVPVLVAISARCVSRVGAPPHP